MFFGLLIENLSLLPILPWGEIIAGAVAAYFFGWLWYGVFFQKRYMALIENKEKKTNWMAMTVQFLALLIFAYLIGILSLFETGFLLGIDALMGIAAFMTLAGILFQRGNTRKAIQFWLITAGYEVIAIAIIATVIWYL